MAPVRLREVDSLFKATHLVLSKNEGYTFEMSIHEAGVGEFVRGWKDGAGFMSPVGSPRLDISATAREALSSSPCLLTPSSSVLQTLSSVT